MRRVIFAALVCLIPLTAVPYGTFEAWWKAAFVCAVFGICILGLIEGGISGSTYVGPWSILLPLLALAAFASIQTLPLGSIGDAGLTGASPWHAISADPYQTRFFVLQMLALTVFLALLYRYANDETSLWILIHVVIAVAVAEIFSIRSALLYALGGAVVMLIGYYSAGLASTYAESIDVAPPMISREAEIIAAMGVVFGLTYWAVAGRRAGAWMQRRKAA